MSRDPGRREPGESVADRVVSFSCQERRKDACWTSRVAGEWTARGRRVQVCTRTK